MSPVIQDWIMPADIIIVQRNVVDDAVLAAMQYFRGMMKVIAVDLDDAYHILPWSNPAKNFWHHRQNGEALKKLDAGLRMSDGLITPNRLLLEDWRDATGGRLYYLQNFAEGKWWTNLPSRYDLKKKAKLRDNIIIGWGGSVSHYDSWWGSGVMEAAKRIAERHRKVKFMICGNDPRIYNDLPVPKRQKIMQIGVPPSEWPKVVRHFDIGLAPIFGFYDQRRSWIKGLEYYLAGVPWIATNGEPYSDFVNMNDFIIQNGADNWEDAMEKILSNLNEYQETAERIVPMARQWIADAQVEHMISVFKSVIQNRRGAIGEVLPHVYKSHPKGEKATDINVKIDGFADKDFDKMAKIQRLNFDYVEKRLLEPEGINGIPIALGMSYNLIQHANRISLAESEQ